MGQTGISVWFVCRLCRGSFGQVDAFIEHKKQKHFTQFQNTTSIVFEESELGDLCPVIIKAEDQLTDENTEPPIKIEVIDDDPIIPFSSEIIDDPNLDFFQPKSELITYESKIIPISENNFVGLKQPEQNPYVLLKRLTSEEIQRACVTNPRYRLLKYEQEKSVNSSPNVFETDKNILDHNAVKKPTENLPSSTVKNMSIGYELQFECKLCSKQLESDAKLKIHVGICALYHEDRNRFCVTCNRKFCLTSELKLHRLRFHGTEEEKMSLFKFKCHVCPKQYQRPISLRIHLESHEETKKHVKMSNAKLQKCPHPNCGKEFRFNSFLQIHIRAVHLDLRPFSCSFPNCNKRFKQRVHMEKHVRTHTGERPFKCTVDNCNKAFITFNDRSRHLRTVHFNLSISNEILLRKNR